MRSRSKKNCPMEGCWEEIPMHRHFCYACTSWWYRVQMKTPAELSNYLKKIGRYVGRLGHLGSRKTKAA
jgi:hypothetical protein